MTNWEKRPLCWIDKVLEIHLGVFDNIFKAWKFPKFSGERNRNQEPVWVSLLFDRHCVVLFTPNQTKSWSGQVNVSGSCQKLDSSTNLEIVSERGGEMNLKRRHILRPFSVLSRFEWMYPHSRSAKTLYGRKNNSRRQIVAKLRVITWENSGKTQS